MRPAPKHLLAAIIGWGICSSGVPQVVSPSHDDNRNESELSFWDRLSSAADFARGDILCDRRLAERQRKRFESLYGERVARLKKAYADKHGPEPDLIKVDSCIRGVTEDFLKKALLKFDADMKLLERHAEN